LAIASEFLNRIAKRVRALGNRARFWFLTVGLTLLLVSVLMFQSVTQLISSSRWVEHTYDVIDNIHSTVTGFLQARSAERSYFATRDKSFLTVYQTELPRMHNNIAKLRASTIDNPFQQARIDELDAAVNAQFFRMSAALADAAAGKIQTADQLIADKTERANAQRIFDVTQRMEAEERRLLKERVSNTKLFATLSLIASAFAVLASMLVISVVYWRVRRDGKERDAAQGRLRDVNDRLQSSLADLQLRDNSARSVALLGELLQICRNTSEALSITARHLAQLIPNMCGTIGLFNNSRDLIEETQAIGNGAGFAREFTPDECWGLRRGRMHEGSGAEPRCSHICEHEDPVFCLPMIAQGQTLGVISVSSRHGFSDIELQTIRTIAEQLSLALANLRLQETLRNQSIRDALTGLFNRRYLEDALTREIARMRRRNEPLSIVMIDVDHFKRFNDTHGHPGGDALLAEFGRLLARHARDEDIAVRYGGEEFALIMPGASLEIAAGRAEVLRDAVKRLHVRLNGKSLGLVTLSAGVAAYPANGSTGQAVLTEADSALYKAKQEGRDRVKKANEHSATGANADVARSA